MNFDPNIKARLVYDDGDEVYLPPEMGEPKTDQLVGTPHEQLSEVCGRVCYDSLGTGRNSVDYHKHLIEVNHGSVYEHPHFTALLVPPGEHPNAKEFSSDLYRCLSIFLNRPGLIAGIEALGTERQLGPSSAVANYGVRATLNYRHLLDWEKFEDRTIHAGYRDTWRGILLALAKPLAPQIVGHLKLGIEDPLHHCNSFEIIEPKYEHEKWITLFMSGSRGFSHEQARHRFNISQRSTRYVDESQSPWVLHPLFSKYFQDEGEDPVKRGLLEKCLESTRDLCRTTYTHAVDALQPYLASKGVDKFTARKQARGAARGFLGNALLTEMMFSASVADWKWMLQQRHSNPADAEIRVLYSAALPELKRSRYGECFREFEPVPAEDGIGTVSKGA